MAHSILLGKLAFLLEQKKSSFISWLLYFSSFYWVFVLGENEYSRWLGLRFFSLSRLLTRLQTSYKSLKQRKKWNRMISPHSIPCSYLYCSLWNSNVYPESNLVWCMLFFGIMTQHECLVILKSFELARSRTWNLLIRSQTHYPLRH